MPQAEGMQSMILANFQNQNNNTCLCYSVLFQWSLGSFFLQGYYTFSVFDGCLMKKS